MKRIMLYASGVHDDKGKNMKICRFLYGKINFEPRSIEPCCDISGLGVPDYPFSGGERDAGEMLARGKGKINVSLDSGDAASYARVKGVNGWDKVVPNLEKYAAHCVDTLQIDLKFIIFEQNNEIAVLEKCFRLCKRLGIKNVQHSFDFREVNSGNVSDKTLLMAAFFLRAALHNSAWRPGGATWKPTWPSGLTNYSKNILAPHDR